MSFQEPESQKVDQLAEVKCASRSSRWMQQEAENGLLFLLIPVALGMGAIIWFSVDNRPSYSLLLSALPFLAAGLYFRQRIQTWVSAFAFLIGIGILGMVSAAWEECRLATVILDSAVTTTVEGVVERREAVGENRWRYVLAVRATSRPKLGRAPTRLTLTVRGAAKPFRMGDILKGRARLSPPSGPALGGLSDFAFSSYFEGIGASGFFYGVPEKLGESVDAPAQVGWLNLLYDFRSHVGDRIRSLVPGDKGAFAAAIITDERRAISAPVLEALREAGLAHIVAISGLNMALAAGIFFVGARSLLVLIPGASQRVSVKKLAASGAIVMVTAYYLISGFGVSAERAYIMMVVMLTAVLFDRPSISLHNIALAATLILLLHPSSIMGASFQMSFGATAALVAGYNIWSKRRQAQDGLSANGPVAIAVSSIAAIIGGTIMTSLIGSLSTAIFSIAHFNQLSGYGLVANLATMPFISAVVMPAGLLGMLAMPFGLEAPFFVVMGWGLEIVIKVATFVASWEGGISTGRAPPYFLAMTSLGLVLVICLRSPLRFAGVFLLASGMLIMLSGIGRNDPDMVIAEDGETLLIHRKSSSFTNESKSSGFLFDRWRNSLKLGEILPSARRPIDLEVDNAMERAEHDKTEDTAPSVPLGKTTRLRLTEEQIKAVDSAVRSGLKAIPNDQFVCLPKLLCLTQTMEGAKIALVQDTRFLGYACDRVNLVIAARAPFTKCRSGVLLVTTAILRRTGTIEILFNGQANPKSWTYSPAFTSTARAWELHRSYDWRSQTYAATDDANLVQTWLSGSGG